MSENYGNASIKALKGADRIRKRPEVMLTKRDIDGARHTVIEMIGNALDEMGAGYGTELLITYFKEHSVAVRDFGRGVPLGWNKEEERWNWDLIYNEMYAGGKYEEDSISEEVFNQIDVNNPATLDSFTYLFPIGTNGLGGFATQASSEFFEVRSYHNKTHGDANTPMVESRMYFEKGVPMLDELEVTETTEPRGTYIHWKPDCKEVFTDAQTDDLDIKWLSDVCTDIAHLKKYKIVVKDEATGTTKEIMGKGLEELIKVKAGKNLASENVITKKQFKKGIFNKSAYDEDTTVVRYLSKIELVLAFTKAYTKSVCFHNSTRMIRGRTYDGVRDAVAQFFSERAREANVRLQASDYEGLLCFIVSTYSTFTSYENQTKQGVSNAFLYELVYFLVYDTLKMEWGKENKDLKEAVSHAIEEAATREKVKAYEKQQREAKKVTRMRKVEGLKECSFKGDYPAEIWFSEGDSAGNALVSARDSKFQAVFALMGKILNCEKASITKILEGENIIKKIFGSIGCCMDIPGTNLFNIKDLKYDKIIIATDADFDGYQIRVLIFLVFYRLAKEILRQGRLYIAESPLYDITLVNGKHIFTYTKEEKDEVVEKYGAAVKRISRSKGLGQNDADMLWETTMCPETRKLTQIKINPDDSNSQEIIECLFGRDRLKIRKDLILDNMGVSIGSIMEVAELDEEMEIGVTA